MKSKSAAVNRARQFALTIGTSSCARDARMASQITKASQGTQASCSPKDESVPCADLCGTRASSLRDLKPTLPLCRVYGYRITCCARLLPRIFCCDIPDLPGDRNRLKRVRAGELLQKLLNLCGFIVFDDHINLLLTLSQRQRVDLWKLSPPVSRPSM